MNSSQDSRPEPDSDSSPGGSGALQASPWPQAGAVDSPAWVGEPDAGRPRPVTAAFWLGVVDVMIGSALLAVQCVASDDLLLRMLGDAEFLLTGGDVRSVYLGILGGLVAMAVLAAALWSLLLFAMLRGREWARLVLTSIAFVWAVSSLLALVGKNPYGPLYVVLEAAPVVALSATVLCMFASSARDHFTYRP